MNENILGKIPPQALELEEAVLGALMVDNEGLIIATEILKPEYFYSEKNKIIFEAISILYKEMKPVDILTVKDELVKIKKLGEIGGALYLTKLTGRIASSAHIEFHSRIIKQKYSLRELIRFSSKLQTECFEDDIDIDLILQNSNKYLNKINDNFYENKSQNILEENEINSEKIIELPPVILQIADENGTQTIYKRLFTLGNFSVVIGKAKTKKTYLLSLLISFLLKMKNLSYKFINNITNDKNLILWFDTEQSNYDSQVVYQRIIKLSGNDKNFKYYNLRKYSPNERCKLVIDALKLFGNETAVCVIDGITDLANAFNDEIIASEISSLMLNLTATYNIHIVTVIHQNKNDNFATGHLGSALMKKAEIIISVTKVKGKVETEVNCDYIRGASPFQPFSFDIDENGMPYLTDSDKEEIIPSNFYEIDKEINF